jgi:hypothetical protein
MEKARIGEDGWRELAKMTAWSAAVASELGRGV